jgi:hypothetical protein
MHNLFWKNLTHVDVKKRARKQGRQLMKAAGASVRRARTHDRESCPTIRISPMHDASSSLHLQALAAELISSQQQAARGDRGRACSDSARPAAQ